MNFIEITDIYAPKLDIYHHFRENAFREDGSFIADSPKVVNLLIEQGIVVRSILATKRYYDRHKPLLMGLKNVTFYLASKEQMQNIVGHKIHHNVMMHGIRPKERVLEGLGDTILMLDEISSTQNVGSIARSLAGLGVGSYLLPKKGPHPYSRRALRVSMGYVSMLNFHTYENIKETILVLKRRGYTIYGAEITSESVALSRVNIAKKWVLIMGHEEKGLSQEILSFCDEVVAIEMIEGVKSLNVAVSASIMVYQFKYGASYVKDR